MLTLDPLIACRDMNAASLASRTDERPDSRQGSRRYGNREAKPKHERLLSEIPNPLHCSALHYPPIGYMWDLCLSRATYNCPCNIAKEIG